MNITIITLEKANERYTKEAIKEYSKRLSRYCKLKYIEVKTGNQVLNAISDRSYTILINTKGEHISSEYLAAKISEVGVNGTSDIAFVVIDNNQMTDEIINRANYHIGISKLDMDINILMIVVYEQIYRAFKIQNNEVYHK